MLQLHNMQTQSQARPCMLKCWTWNYLPLSTHNKQCITLCDQCPRLASCCCWAYFTQKDNRKVSQQPAAWSEECVVFQFQLWNVNTGDTGHIHISTYIHSIAAPSYQLHTLRQASFCPLLQPPSACFWSLVITSATRSARVGPIYVSMTITIILKSRMLMIVV